MTCWAIIPVKGSEAGKRRLAGALDDAERRALIEAMLTRVAQAVAKARGIDRTLIVGPAPHALAGAIDVHPDPGGGLNAAVSAALAAVADAGATRAVVIAADLPQVTARDLELLALAPDATVAIAPDRHNTGTNALSLPLPQAASFGFAFGADSFARHQAAADALGLATEIVESPGLMRDIDVAADLADATELLEE